MSNHLGSYEGYLDINKGLFGFGKLDNPRNFMFDSDSNKPCFDAVLAMRGFHKAVDGVCNCTLTDVPNNITGEHFTLEDLTALFVVVDAAPIGLVYYFEFSGDEDFYLTQRGNTFTKTLQEQFRLLLEWKYAHEHLDNNEEVAITASQMCDILNIPITIQEWVLSEVPNEKVNRFLEGRTNALQRTEELIPDLTEEFKEWLLDKFNKAKTFGEHE